MQQTVMHFFHLCSCGHNLDIEADLHLVLVVVVVVVVVVLVVLMVAVVVPSSRTGFGWTLRMLTSLHTYLWTVTLQHMAFPSSTSFVMITWVEEQMQR
jgi:hypothetical protein